MDWQPIETAPKNGTRILGYFPKEGINLPVVMPCLFDDGEWQFDIWDAPDRKAEPSYWAILGELPK